MSAANASASSKTQKHPDAAETRDEIRESTWSPLGCFAGWRDQRPQTRGISPARSWRHLEPAVLPPLPRPPPATTAVAATAAAQTTEMAPLYRRFRKQRWP